MFAKQPSKSAAQAASDKVASLPAEQEMAVSAPGSGFRPADMMRLQRTIGNRAVQRMLEGAVPAAEPADARQPADSASAQAAANAAPMQAPAAASAPGKDNPLEEQREEELEGMSIKDILAGAPSSGERTREDMERDIRMAQKTVDKILGDCGSLDEISSYFPLLQLRFGLKHIGYKDLGTPTAQVFMEINPKAACLFSHGNEYTLNRGDNHGMADKQDVTFQTAQSTSGHTWATEMEAAVLGPNHPQGFGPAEQRPLMRHLPTNRKKHPGLENRYIRGHLLNDSLGGPGLEQNLFPITERANKDHEQYVESEVKKWVNELGYFVYYHVEVKNIRENINKKYIDDNRNYVDADLHCEAYVLSVTGGRSKLNSYINCVIKSEHAVVHAPVDGGITTPKGADDADASHKKFVANKWVELSVTKNKGEKGFENVIDEIADKVMEFYDVAMVHLEKNARFYSLMTQKLSPSLNKVSGQNLNLVLQSIILDKDGDVAKINDIRNSYFSQVGVWNHITNELAKNEDTIADLLDEMTTVVDLYDGLTGPEIQWLGKFLFNCMDKMVFLRLLEDSAKAEDRIDQMKEAMYAEGWKAARSGNGVAVNSESYRKGQKDYAEGFARAEGGLDCNGDTDGFKVGHQDYLDGFARAQTQNDQEFNHAAYTAAFNEYKDGFAKAQQGLAPADDHHARQAAHKEYDDGWRDADQGALYNSNTIAYRAGYDDYTAGLADARAGAGKLRAEHAYGFGYDGYQDGWGDAAAGANAPLHNGEANTSGYQDYTAGWTAASNGVPGPAAGNDAFNAAFNAYKSGLADSQNDLAQQNNTAAYINAYTDYRDGCSDAHQDHGNNKNTDAYTIGYNEYHRGLTDAGNDLDLQQHTSAYTLGHTQYCRGQGQAELDNEPEYDNFAYMEGYRSVGRSYKRQKL